MNMDYCKFENTLKDLRQCFPNAEEGYIEVDAGMNRDEKQAFEDMKEFIKEIAETIEHGEERMINDEEDDCEGCGKPTPKGDLDEDLKACPACMEGFNDATACTACGDAAREHELDDKGYCPPCAAREKKDGFGE